MRETSPTPIRVSPRRVRDRFPITLFHPARLHDRPGHSGTHPSTIPADPVPPEAGSVKTVHFLAYSRTDLHHPPRALPGTPAPRPVCALVPLIASSRPSTPAFFARGDLREPCTRGLASVKGFATFSDQPRKNVRIGFLRKPPQSRELGTW